MDCGIVGMNREYLSLISSLDKVLHVDRTNAALFLAGPDHCDGLRLENLIQIVQSHVILPFGLQGPVWCLRSQPTVPFTATSSEVYGVT